MKDVELYAKVRHAVRIAGLSKRAVARRFGIDPRTVDKMLEFSVPPGYRRSTPPVKPKLGPFIAIIDGILAEDKGRPKKQQHTSKRIFERLRDEQRTGSVDLARVTTRAKSKGLSVTRGGTSWCRSRFSPASRRSTPICWTAAESAWAIACAVTARRSASGWSAIWPLLEAASAALRRLRELGTSVSSLSLVRYRLNDYSVPTTSCQEET